MRSFCFGAMMAAVALGLTAAAASGQTNTYWLSSSGTPSSWNTASNWSAGLPISSSGTTFNTANINNGGTAIISGTGVTDYAGGLYLGADYLVKGTSGGNIIQTSGTLNAGSAIRFNAGAKSNGQPYTASYSMSGGLLTAQAGITMQGWSWGAGNNVFSQSGGTVAASSVELSSYSGSSTYSLSSGQLFTPDLEIGNNGKNIFNQSGGQVLGAPALRGAFISGSADVVATIGPGGTGPAAYYLSGSGQLATSLFYIKPTGSFIQTSGSVVVNCLFDDGCYTFSGGSLTASYGLEVSGILDFGGSVRTLSVSEGVINFSTAVIRNGSQTSFSSGPQSLVIVTSTFNTGQFGGGWNPGNLVHTAGTALNISGTQGFTGWGNINDHLTCTGTIDAGTMADGSSIGLNLNSGVNVNSGGYVNLRGDYNTFILNGPQYYGGALNVQDAVSGVSGGGTLVAGYEFIGTGSGAGTFTQSGGSNTAGLAFPNFTKCVSGFAVDPGLYLGFAPNNAKSSAGTYYLSGTGSLWAPYIGLGISGSGVFNQSGGQCTVTPNATNNNTLLVGLAYTSTYQLSGGTLNTNSAGVFGTQVEIGSFLQTGGYHNANYLGVGAAGEPWYGQVIYNLSGSGQLNVGTGGEDIGGQSSSASFLQNGGTHSVSGDVLVGGANSLCTNVFLLNSGPLTVGSNLNLSSSGTTSTSTFTQTGGTAAITGSVLVAGLLYPGVDTFENGLSGAYNLRSSGILSAGAESVGQYGVGTFTQSGGTNTVSGQLIIGETVYGTGSYTISGATSQVSASTLVVAGSGSGAFTQNSGTVTVSGAVVVGQSGSGVYTMSGGTLTAGSLSVGSDTGSVHGTGVLKTTGAQSITLTSSLYLGQNGMLNLAPGTTIYMNGSSFGNMSQKPSCAATMSNLTLVFQGGAGVTDTFEVAGLDLGISSGSAVNNFLLGTLQLGGTQPGRVQLVNQSVNQTSSSGSECLYVQNLVIGYGSYLDLNHQKVYYGALTNNGTVNMDGGILEPYNSSTVFSGTNMPIDDDGSIVLSSSGPYVYGQVITATASAKAGYVFSGWNLAGYGSTINNSAATTTSLTVYGNFTLTADYTAVPSTVYCWGNNTAGECGDGTLGIFAWPWEVVGTNGSGALTGITGLSVGGHHTAAVRNDGAVLTWGENNIGQLGDGTTTNRSVPYVVASLVNSGITVRSVAAGNDFTLAITPTGGTTNGVVYAWGNNGVGQLGIGSTTPSIEKLPVLVSGLSNVIAAVCDNQNTGATCVAVTVTGGVWAWGETPVGDGTSTNRSAPVKVVTNVGSHSLSGVVAVSGCYQHYVALTSSGTVWCWGHNFAGQLGDGTQTDRNGAVQVLGPGGVGTLTGITAVAAGQALTLAVRNDGTLWMWGNYANLTPVQVPGYGGSGNLTGISTTLLTALGAGYQNNFAISGTGSLWAWGTGQGAEVGNGSDANAFFTPVLVAGPGGQGVMTGVVAAGDGNNSHSAILRSDGTVWAWGDNGYGQIGQGYFNNNPNGIKTTPVQPAGLTNVVAVTSGFANTEALCSDGTVWGWGLNNGTYGTIGDGTLLVRDTPAQVSNSAGTGPLTGIIGLSAGWEHTAAVRNDGTVWTWGDNSVGELGYGTSGLVETVLPGQVLAPGGTGALGGIVAVSTGANFTLALTSSGTVWSWGSNFSGQLGNGLTTNSYLPVQVAGPGGVGYLTGIVAISAGSDQSLALRNDGTLWAWGGNAYGELGISSTSSQGYPVQVKGVGGAGNLTGITAVSAGYYSTLAVGPSGTVYAWGYNNDGQLGISNTTSKTAPVVVLGPSGTGSLTNITSVAAHYMYSVAVRNDGTVWAWGYNNNGQLGISNTNSQGYPVQVLGVNGTGNLGGILVAAQGEGSSHTVVEVIGLTLAAGTNLTAGGTVTVIPSQASYTPSSVLTITAAANPGYTFSNWTATGGTVTSVSSTTTALTINNNCTLTANFAAVTYSLTVVASPSAGGSVSPVSTTGTYQQVISIVGTSSPGYTFSNWTANNGAMVASATASATTVTLPANSTTLTANFSQNSYSGSETGGTIVMSNSGPYFYGQVITATASAQAGYFFNGWSVSGSCALSSSSAVSMTMTIYSSFTLTAQFTQETLTITAATSSAWVYQNTAGTTLDRHVVALTVSVTGDTFGNNNYTVTVTQSGPGVVTPTQSWTSGVLVTPATTASWSVAAGGNLSGYLAGGRVNGPVNSSDNLALTGSCTVTVIVAGDVGGTATATVVVTVRPLGGIGGNGPASANDLTILDNCLNGLATNPGGDLTGDGAVTTADRVMLNMILNGLAMP